MVFLQFLRDSKQADSLFLNRWSSNYYTGIVHVGKLSDDLPDPQLLVPKNIHRQNARRRASGN